MPAARWFCGLANFDRRDARFPRNSPMSLEISADSLPKARRATEALSLTYATRSIGAVSGVPDTPAGDINQPDPRRVATATRTSRGRYTTLSTPRCEYPASCTDFIRNLIPRQSMKFIALAWPTGLNAGDPLEPEPRARIH